MDEIITIECVHVFDDGFAIEVIPDAKNIIYNFYNKDKKKYKVSRTNKDPLEWNPQVPAYQEIKNHVNEDKITDTLMILSDILNQYHIAKIKEKEAMEEAMKIEKEYKLHEMAMEGQNIIDMLLNTSLSEYVESLFDELSPGNGKIAMIYWASAIATVKGNPQIGVIKGGPGEGKTRLMEYVLKAIPDEHIIRMNGASDAVLFNFGDVKGSDYLDKKIVYLGDLGDKNGFNNTIEMRKILRVLQTDGHFARPKSVKEQSEDGIVDWAPKMQELEGHPAMWYTTVREDSELQDMDRSIVSTTNLEQEKEIRRIIRLIKKDSKTGRRIKEIVDIKLPELQNVFQYLVMTEHEFICPYPIEEMKYRFRDTERLLYLSEIIAELDYASHEKHDKFYFVSEKDLYIVAEFLYKGTSKLNDAVMKKLNELYQEYNKSSFTRTDALGMFADSYTTTSNIARDLLKPAVKAKFLFEDKEGKEFKYSFIKEPSRNKFEFNLPEIDWDDLEDEYGIKKPKKPFDESKTWDEILHASSS